MNLREVRIEHSSLHSTKKLQQLEWARPGTILTVKGHRTRFMVAFIKIDKYWYAPETGGAYMSEMVKVAAPEFMLFHHGSAEWFE